MGKKNSSYCELMEFKAGADFDFFLGGEVKNFKITNYEFLFLRRRH